MMNRYEWILFDADHTLFDFDKASEESMSQVMSDYGIRWREEMYADYKKINIQCWLEHEQGIIDRDTLIYERFRRYFDFMGWRLDPVSAHEKYLEALGSKPYLMPGAEEILQWLDGKVKIGYITNGISTVQRTRLEKIGWQLRFDVIVIAGEIGYSKPHFEYFEFVHRQIGTPEKSRVIVVGDSLTADIEGASTFGYQTCWYNPVNGQCHSIHKPDYMIGTLCDLKNILVS